MKRTLFLQAPSFDGYDGGAGARYQMKREVRSFWYPTWLAQPAAMIEGSRLIDAPAHDQSWDDIKHEIDDKELIVLHTSTPSFNQDVRTAELIKARNPDVLIGFVGAKVAVEPDKSLAASTAIDFVAREEYDFTLLEIAEGKPLSEVDGINYRAPDGSIDYTAVTLGRDAPVALGNLAPGSRADDAVNLAQLQASAAATLDSANAYADARVDPLRQDLWRLERRVDDIERRMDAGIAAAMGLKQAPAVSGRTTYYVGAGTWRGQQAGGLSLRRTADNGRWSLEGGVSGNREGVGGYLGVSGVLGR